MAPSRFSPIVAVRIDLAMLSAGHPVTPFALAMKFPRLPALLLTLALAATGRLAADDGYRLWLRYEPIPSPATRAADTAALQTIRFATPGGTDSPTLAAARTELATALSALLGLQPRVVLEAAAPASTAGDGYEIVGS